MSNHCLLMMRVNTSFSIRYSFYQPYHLLLPFRITNLLWRSAASCNFCRSSSCAQLSLARPKYLSITFINLSIFFMIFFLTFVFLLKFVEYIKERTRIISSGFCNRCILSQLTCIILSVFKQDAF